MTKRSRAIQLPTIYEVRREYGGAQGELLGYGAGTREDIEAYYREGPEDLLYLEPIDVPYITPDAAKRRQALLAQKSELEAKLDALVESLD